MPAIMMERPKISRAMWEALKSHIMRERQRKKQEQEADAEVERLRKEREHQQKQDVMTLGETREQITQLETRLAKLKEEKHELFLQLKKVLHEDETRRRQLVKDSNDMANIHGYTTNTLPLTGHSQIFLQPPVSVPARVPLYKVSTPNHPQHTLLSQGPRKRSRSPSPPPQGYPQAYGIYKTSAMAPYQPQKIAATAPQYPVSQPSAFYGHPPVSQVSQPSHVTSTVASYSPAPAQTLYTYSQYTQPPSGTPQRDEAGKQQVTSVYMPHGQPPRGYVGSLHQPMEHSGQKPSFSEQDKYYPAPVPLHGAAIPIQQPAQVGAEGAVRRRYLHMYPQHPYWSHGP